MGTTVLHSTALGPPPYVLNGVSTPLLQFLGVILKARVVVVIPVVLHVAALEKARLSKVALFLFRTERDVAAASSNLFCAPPNAICSWAATSLGQNEARSISTTQIVFLSEAERQKLRLCMHVTEAAASASGTNFEAAVRTQGGKGAQA